MRARRFLLALVVGVSLVLTAGVPPAEAGPILDRAADALRRDPVYVDPEAERQVTGGDADRIRERVRRGGQRVFVAVLPEAAADEADGGAGELALALGREVRSRGTYAVVAGDRFSAASTVLEEGQASALMSEAARRHGGAGPTAVLVDFVDRVERSAGSARRGERDAGDGGGDRGGGGVGLLLPLLVLGALGGGGFLLWRRRKRAREAREARESLRPELQVLADDVLALEPQVSLHPEARADYDAAVSRYRSAEAAIANVESVAQADRVRRVLAEGSYAMARARARIDGREPPPPPAELTRPGPNQEPAVVVDDRGEPAYAGYGGGWYGGGWFGGGDLLTGILIGSALGGPGWGWGHEHHHEDHGGGEGDGGDGGDFGGGDFGGGDFGGGDFGGGDFGGGDFGGGDF